MRATGSTCMHSPPTFVCGPSVTVSSINSSTFRPCRRLCSTTALIATDLGSGRTKTVYSIRGSQMMQSQPNHVYLEPDSLTLSLSPLSRGQADLSCLFYTPLHLTSPLTMCTCWNALYSCASDAKLQSGSQ